MNKQHFSKDLLSKGFFQVSNYIIDYQEELGLTDTLLIFIIKILRYSKNWIIQDTKVFPNIHTETLRKKRKQLKDMGLLCVDILTTRNNDGTFRCTGIKYDFSPLENKLLGFHRAHQPSKNVGADNPNRPCHSVTPSTQNSGIETIEKQGQYNTNTIKNTTTISSPPSAEIEGKKSFAINDCIEIHRCQFIQATGYKPPAPTIKETKWLSSLYQQNELNPLSNYLTVMSIYIDEQRKLDRWIDPETQEEFVPLLSFWKSIPFRRNQLEKCWDEIQDERLEELKWEQKKEERKRKDEQSSEQIKLLLETIDKEAFFQWMKEEKKSTYFEKHKKDFSVVSKNVEEYRQQERGLLKEKRNEIFSQSNEDDLTEEEIIMVVDEVIEEMNYQ